VPAFDAARLDALEVRLTRQWLAGAGLAVPVGDFLANTPTPSPTSSAVETAVAEPVADSADAPIELDHEYDWRTRQR
jgi:hypothetical protein